MRQLQKQNLMVAAMCHLGSTSTQSHRLILSSLSVLQHDAWVWTQVAGTFLAACVIKTKPPLSEPKQIGRYLQIHSTKVL